MVAMTNPPPCSPSVGIINRIEVENFKSYRGPQTIGPFRGFTAVVGPNGAGKSNLMDAVSFVLGVGARQLRGSALRELLYSPGGDVTARGDDGSHGARPTRGHVRLVLDIPDDRPDAGSSPGVTRELVFERAIRPAGGTDAQGEPSFSCSYRIDGRAVGADDYDARLAALGVVSKARNFLVFQGDVESVAGMSPRGLTDFFEKVSGVDALKRPYAEAEAAKNDAEERAALLWAKRRAVLAERKVKREQRQEAEEHLKARAELDSLRAEHCLWRLEALALEEARARAELDELRGELKGTAEVQRGAETRARELAREAGRHHKAAAVARKRADARAAAAEGLAPDRARAVERLRHLERRVNAAEKQRADAVAREAEQRAAAEGLKRDLAKVDKLRQAEERRTTAEGSDAEPDVAAHLAAYQRCKEQAGVATAATRQEAARVAAELRTDEETRDRLTSQVAGIAARVHTVTARSREGQSRLDDASKRAASLAAELAEKRSALATLRAEMKDGVARRVSAEAALDEAEARLAEAKADRKESDRDRRAAEAVRQLQGAVTGVHGRLADLGRVPRREDQLALAMAMTRDLDAVVCRDEATARRAVQYLKDQRVPPMTFLPLDTLVAKPDPAHLRSSLGGTARLAIDAVEYDPAYERAFRYALGACLLADTAAEARTLAFAGAERRKVVSLDGTVFQKAGLITGGLTHDAAGRARRWDDAAIGALRDARDRARAAIDALPSERRHREAEQALRDETEALEERSAGAAGDVAALVDHVETLNKELAALQSERTTLAPELKATRASAAQRSARLAELKRQEDAVVDATFADFSRSVGVDNIREWEETRLKQQTERAERSAELRTQQSRLAAQIEYEEGRAEASGRAATEAAKLLAMDEVARAEAVAAVDKAREASATAEAEAAALRVEAEEAAKKTASTNESLAELRREIAATERDGMAAARRADAKEAALGDLAAQAADLIQRAEADGVVIPRLPPAVAAEVDMDGHEGAAVGPPDFSRIRAEYRTPQARAQAARIEGEFAAALGSLASALELKAPNLKAAEQCAAAELAYEEHQRLVDASKTESASASKVYEEIRARRAGVFMACVDRVGSTIDDVYKELTRSAHHPFGGTAYLSVETPDDPLSGGVRFTAMPPSKRFRDMDQLSGGERTVAALALLFAVHAHRPSPFFVLDEVDAALDASAVARVAAYVRRRSRGVVGEGGIAEGNEAGGAGPAPFQAVVISLKDSFFDQADSLVGVTKDAERRSSRTLTFDLEPYGPPVVAG